MSDKVNQDPAELLLGECDMQLFMCFYGPKPRACLQLPAWRCCRLCLPQISIESLTPNVTIFGECPFKGVIHIK